MAQPLNGFLLWNAAMLLVSIIAVVIAVQTNVFAGVFAWSLLTLLLLFFLPDE